MRSTLSILGLALLACGDDAAQAPDGVASALDSSGVGPAFTPDAPPSPTVDAAPLALAWGETSVNPHPPPRYGHAMVYDSDRDVVVLFGGDADGSYYHDTWEYDGTSWRQVATVADPGIRRYSAMAYDASRRRVVLFGGNGVLAASSDTWEYDGTTWTQTSPSESPPGRWAHALVYDVSRARVVLFGGVGLAGAMSDTWEYDGSQWVEVMAASGPPGRHSHRLVFDEERGRVVLLGGSGAWGSFAGLNDTWERVDGTWLEATPAASPPGRYGHAMAYDEERKVTVVFGGSSDDLQTWSYDGTMWTAANAMPHPAWRVDSQQAYHRGSRSVVLMGGRLWSSPYTVYGDSWTFGLR